MPPAKRTRLWGPKEIFFAVLLYFICIILFPGMPRWFENLQFSNDFKNSQRPPQKIKPKLNVKIWMSRSRLSCFLWTRPWSGAFLLIWRESKIVWHGGATDFSFARSTENIYIKMTCLWKNADIILLIQGLVSLQGIPDSVTHWILWLFCQFPVPYLKTAVLYRVIHS